MSEVSDLRWFQTGNDPERYELAEDLHPLNESMTVEPVGYVERTGSGEYRWETYTNPHHRGTTASLDEAKARVDYFRDPGQ